MDLYDDLDLLLNDLDNDLVDIVGNDVAPALREEMHESSEGIYPMYDNTFKNRYEQGVAGSFGDIDSIRSELTKISNGVELEVTNDAHGSLLDSNSYLDEIIYSGKGYEFSSKPVPARDFLTPVINDLDESQLVENILERKLKQKGYGIS